MLLLLLCPALFAISPGPSAQDNATNLTNASVGNLTVAGNAPQAQPQEQVIGLDVLLPASLIVCMLALITIFFLGGNGDSIYHRIRRRKKRE